MSGFIKQLDGWVCLFFCVFSVHKLQLSKVAFEQDMWHLGLLFTILVIFKFQIIYQSLRSQYSEILFLLLKSASEIGKTSYCMGHSWQLKIYCY